MHNSAALPFCDRGLIQLGGIVMIDFAMEKGLIIGNPRLSDMTIQDRFTLSIMNCTNLPT